MGMGSSVEIDIFTSSYQDMANLFLQHGRQFLKRCSNMSLLIVYCECSSATNVLASFVG